MIAKAVEKNAASRKRPPEKTMSLKQGFAREGASVAAEAPMTDVRRQPRPPRQGYGAFETRAPHVHVIKHKPFQDRRFYKRPLAWAAATSVHAMVIWQRGDRPQHDHPETASIPHRHSSSLPDEDMPGVDYIINNLSAWRGRKAPS